MSGCVLDNSAAMRWLLASLKKSDQAYAEAVLQSLVETEALVLHLWHLEASASLHSDTSRPFTRPESGRIAVKVIIYDTLRYIPPEAVHTKETRAMPAQHAKNIALTPELESWVDELVASGSYKSASEVMRDALRALRERQERHQAELTKIQARIALSLDQADRGDYASGSGEDAMRRAFETGIKRACVCCPGG